MNRALEKILKKIEEIRNKYQRLADGSNFDGWNEEDIKYSAKAEMCEELKEIVQEVAEEYKAIYMSKEEVGYMLDSIEMRGDETWMDYYRKALKGLCELTDKEYNGGWIACSERLPEPIRPVLVTLKNWMNDKCFVRVGRFHTDHWKTDEGIVENSVVIAWQPLPQPYQPKGE